MGDGAWGTLLMERGLPEGRPPEWLALEHPEVIEEVARLYVEAGADLYLGHSAHLFQGVEVYRGRPIFYDAGDFVDDYAVDPLLRLSAATGDAFYRQMAGLAKNYRLGSLKNCVSAGEALPDATRQLFKHATGIEIIDGIGDYLTRSGIGKITELIGQGQNKDQIIAYFVGQYGEKMLAAPAKKGFNLVAWVVPEADLKRIGQHLAGQRAVTHCYARRPAPSWPYTLYTMIHGRTPEECVKIAAKMAAETGVHDYEMLFSETELKKTTMRYFKEGEAPPAS